VIKPRRISASLRWALLALSTIFVATLAWFWARQYLLRHRAEQLLNEVRSLEIGASSYEDARRIYDHWTPWTTPESSCYPNQCDFRITLQHSMAYDDHLWDDLQRVLFRARVAPRPAYVGASVKVQELRVSEISYGTALLVEAYPTAAGDFGPYELIGAAKTVRNQAELAIMPKQHPQYRVGRPGGCDGPCLMTYATSRQKRILPTFVA
jgi:hypothetical protein